MSSTNSKDIRRFRAIVWKHYGEHGRHDLPWRKTTDAYKILVSEVMLQQTQVRRVIDKYKSFLQRFPTTRSLAKAPLSAVLKEWSGLGYNRRAKYLLEAAKVLASKKKPTPDDFIGLPGVGPYTASAVRVFAFNEPDVLIETNTRAAIIQHFLERSVLIHDREIKRYAEKAAEGQDPREWHWALMDYGAYLKQSGVRHNHRSVHYTKQSKFEGSLRQVRGAILRALHEGPLSEQQLITRLRIAEVTPEVEPRGVAKKKAREALGELAKDGLIIEVKGSARGGSALGRKWRIA